MSANPRIFDRRCRVTVDGRALASTPEEGHGEGLRVGFTIEKDLDHKKPNTAEISIYNLARSSRKRLAEQDNVNVVVEAGYRESGLTVLFIGQMREAYSRAESDGTWVTILRAGDGDHAVRKARKATSLRPGVSLDRVVSESLAALRVGAGNVVQALKNKSSLDEAFKMGVNLSGNVAKGLGKQLGSAGMNYSIQDGELQVLDAGKVLGVQATFLSPATGLEGAPEVDTKGVVNCRVRLIPGLNPGMPVELDHATTELSRIGSGWYEVDITPRGNVYGIRKTRYIGDSFGQDWVAELELVEIR